MHPTPFTIRTATDGDRSHLDRLAQLDSQPALCGPAFIGEIGGKPAAAVCLADGRVVADPFTPTAVLVQHLRLQAASLCGPAARPPRRRLAALVAAAGTAASPTRLRPTTA
jgi:hypothetical protein